MHPRIYIYSLDTHTIKFKQNNVDYWLYLFSEVTFREALAVYILKISKKDL